MNIDHVCRRLLKLCYLFASLWLLTLIPDSVYAISLPLLEICPPSIGFGETIQCSILSVGETDSYTFAANAGDTILVRMSKSSGDFFPMIKILDSDEYQLCISGHSSIAADIESCTLPATGTYTILAYDWKDGSQTGDYYLYIQRLNDPGNAIAIPMGETLSGDIATPAEMDTYVFSANAGDVVVSWSKSSETIYTRIGIFGPDGSLLCENYSPNAPELVNCTLPGIGSYTILAYAYLGTDTGNYYVHLQRLNSPANAVPISFGETVSAAILTPAEIDTYIFDANAGDKVLVEISKSSGNLYYPKIMVVSPSGDILCETGYASVTAEITDCQLPSTGTYTILTYDWLNGTSVGDYYLFLQRLNAPGNAVPISLGQTLSGEISTPAEMDTFTFSVNAGDVMLGRSISTGSIYPRMRIFGSDGSQVCDSDNTRFVNCTLTEAGVHTILISESYGKDIGDYFFFLQRLNNPINATPITFGQTLSDSIMQPVETDTYIFTASAGDMVLLRMNSLSGDLYPKIQVYDLEGILLCETELASSMAMIANCSIPSSGTYTILASDFFGTKTGDYSLYLQQNNPDNPVSITFGVQQEIEVTPDVSLWFQVEVLNNAENLFISLQKYDSWNGDLKLHDDTQILTSTSGYEDHILQWSSPTPGTYLVEVTGSGGGRLTAYAELPELSLGQWIVGSIYHSWGSAWYQLILPTDQDSLHLKAETLGLYSEIKVYKDNLDGMLAGSTSGPTMNLDIPSPQAGIYYVQLTDSAWIQGNVQTRDHMLRVDVDSIEAPPCTIPVISSFSPDKGGNAGEVTITINGQCLDPESTVQLTQNDNNSVSATLVNGADDGRSLIATFNLLGTEPGNWNLVVTNPANQSIFAPIPFTVENAGSTQLWLEVLARENIRVGQAGKVLIRVGNNGLVDARHVMVAISTSQDVQWDTTIEDYDPRVSHDDPDLHDHLYFDIFRLAPEKIEEIELSVSASALTTWPLNVYLLEPNENIPVVSVTNQAPYNGTEPALGAILVSGPSGIIRTGHVGIYVGNGKVVEVLVDGKVHGERTIAEFSTGGDILTATLPQGVDGAKIAELAKQYVGTQRDYRAPALKAGSWDCATFLLEVYEKAGFPIIGPANFGRFTAPADLYEWLTGKYWPETHTLDQIFKYTAKREILELQIDFLKFDIFELMKFITSVSPEDKYGSAGFDLPQTPTSQMKHWVPGNQPLAYRIDFWNKEDAPAATVDVIITDTLDPNLDWNTFKFTEVGFLDWKATLEPTQYFNIDIYNVSIDLSPYYPGQPTETMTVNVEGTFNPDTGEIRWEFHALDPLTHEPPENPYAGFLPPITDSGWEIGWVNFSVSPKSDLPSGTVINNQSFVKFDLDVFKPAPKEGPFINTLDTEPPSSTVQSPTGLQQCNIFPVSWSGTDDTNGSGLRGIDVYVDNLGDTDPPYLWTNMATHSAIYIGVPGQIYGFYTRARDNVGKVETPPQSMEYDVVVTAGPVCPPPPGVVSHYRDFSIPFVPPSGLAVGLLPILTKTAQQGQLAMVVTPSPTQDSSIDMPKPAHVKATSVPQSDIISNVMDAFAPETTLLTTPGSTGRQRTAFFTYESTDAGTFLCSLDGSAYFTCSDSIRFTGLSEGVHVFEVRALNDAGNYDSTPAIFTWTVERKVNVQRHKYIH